ncbi:MAG: hypothetical protein ACK5GN_12760 [Pseudomonadota bacterium]|jgi:flagellar biosynthesis protein FliQ
MESHLYEMWEQAWRLALTIVVPTLAIPLVSIIFSVVFGLMGVRDEGVAYATRVVALIGVGMLTVPIVASSLVSLMTHALR